MTETHEYTREAARMAAVQRREAARMAAVQLIVRPSGSLCTHILATETR